ncbi:MAG: hypothetical protein E6R05_03255 [Candidatus Moraniibacteriota bacterium]|nr:MAG: hypothetical protein E6R05_03255 [Candidatus Moranbacteria bacterium]
MISEDRNEIALVVDYGRKSPGGFDFAAWLLVSGLHRLFLRLAIVLMIAERADIRNLKNLVIGFSPSALWSEVEVNMTIVWPRIVTESAGPD